jgi:deoxycytidylate deaminase
MTEKRKDSSVPYPYMPTEGIIHYVSADNTFMQAARAVAAEQSLDKTMPTGSVIVRDNTILGKGANGSTYHETHGCERVRLHIPTGQGYELCEGCSPKNHSEPKAIADARKNTKDLRGTVVYLWGHWWCCESCWNAMFEQGINTVYLLENSEILFNKDATGNIVGRQLLA